MRSNDPPTFNELFLEPNPTHQAVNALIAGMVDRQYRPISDLTGETSSVAPTQRGEEMSAALNELENLERNNGTPGEIAAANAEVEKLLAQARSGGEQNRDELGQFSSGFDGGVRRSGARRPTLGHGEESPNDLMFRAMSQSPIERDGHREEQRRRTRTGSEDAMFRSTRQPRRWRRRTGRSTRRRKVSPRHAKSFPPRSGRMP